MFRQITWYSLVLLLLLTSAACRRSAPTPVPETPGGQTEATPGAQKAPEYVWKVLKYVQQHSEAPKGYVGGRAFENREKLLPLKSVAAKTIRYREWDVFPKENGVNRGPERLITGSDGSAYYTKNHYKSFQALEVGH